jgi:hypothetical protein
MAFKVGDLVRIVDDSANAANARWARVGMCGEIVLALGYVSQRPWYPGLYWRVTFSGVELSAHESILEKIPGGGEGRKVVDFDWRTLTAPEEVSA